MKKFFNTLLGLILIVIVVLVVVLFLGWSRIPDMVANHLSKKMKVPVGIEAIHFTTDSIKIDQLEIGSPKGYTLQKAFSSDTLLVKAPLTHYFQDQIVIDEIKIDQIYLAIEFERPGSSKGNWTTIMQNYKNATTHSPPSSQATSSKTNKPGKSVLIKRLLLTNINVDLAYKEGGVPLKHLKPISQLEFTNITSQKGIPSEQITQLILEQALRSIFDQENLQNMIEGFMQSPQQGVQNLLSPLKDFLP